MTGNCGTFEPFALRVFGSDMEPPFADGTIITVDPGETIRDGDFVVVKIDGMVELRKLSIANDRWTLATTNGPASPPRATRRDDVLGRVVQYAHPKGGRRVSLP